MDIIGTGLAGISDRGWSAIESIGTLNIMAPIIIIGLGIICLVVLFSWLKHSCDKTKSGEYRSLMADMYVVGMIKKFADEDGINLMKELKEFGKIQRKKKYSKLEIDEVIAENLKEKISSKTDKQVEAIDGGTLN